MSQLCNAVRHKETPLESIRVIKLECGHFCCHGCADADEKQITCSECSGVTSIDFAKAQIRRFVERIKESMARRLDYTKNEVFLITSYFTLVSLSPFLIDQQAREANQSLVGRSQEVCSG